MQTISRSCPKDSSREVPAVIGAAAKFKEIQMVYPVFNEQKAVQIGAILFNLSGGSITYLKLARLMYLVERESLLKHGRPIMYDELCSHEYGPLPRTILNAMTKYKWKSCEESLWFQYFSELSDDGYSVKLLKDCLSRELSQANEDLIKNIYEQCGDMNAQDLRLYLRKTVSEWIVPVCGTSPITYRDILKAGGKSPEDIEQICQEIEGVMEMTRLLGNGYELSSEGT